jgi:hypothetical protein
VFPQALYVATSSADSKGHRAPGRRPRLMFGISLARLYVPSDAVQGAEEQEVQRTYLGVCTSQVVGIQHYTGFVNNREMVRYASCFIAR